MLSVLRTLRSLRWRLTLTYVALVVVLLSVLGVAQYVALRHALIDSRIATLSGDVDAAKALFARASARNLAPDVAANRFAVMVSTLSGRTVDVLALDSNHTPLARVPATAAIPQLDAATLSATAANPSASSHSPGDVLQGNNGDVLAVAYPISSANFHGTVELAATMEPLDTVLSQQFRQLLAYSLGAALVALGVGLRLTSRRLQPLRRLTATVGELAGGDLGARSRLEHRDDEVGTLGQAFDEMADRIEASFAARAESEAQMRRFIADASHELRTPVTSLKGYIDVMRRGAGRDPESLDAILESMQREADRMRLLVLDLLTLARLDAEKPLSLEPVDINELLNAVLDEGVGGMPGRLIRDFSAQPATVSADRSALITVARNLLINACKYAPGAEQTWSTSRGRDSTGRELLTFTVQDAGPGIPAADLPHLFERFYRGEKTRAREEGGSGLGLSIVKGLVENMGGDVAATSDPGSGTMVSVNLPVAVPSVGASNVER